MGQICLYNSYEELAGVISFKSVGKIHILHVKMSTSCCTQWIARWRADECIWKEHHFKTPHLITLMITLPLVLQRLPIQEAINWLNTDFIPEGTPKPKWTPGETPGWICKNRRVMFSLQLHVVKSSIVLRNISSVFTIGNRVSVSYY